MSGPSRVTRGKSRKSLAAGQTGRSTGPGKDTIVEAMRECRSTIEHPFGTIKAWVGATHFQMNRLKNVSTEMALDVLACNLTRVLNIIGVKGLMRAIAA